MDGKRNYPDDSDAPWYSGDRGYDSERYQVPEPRYGEDGPGRYADHPALTGDLGRPGDPRADLGRSDDRLTPGDLGRSGDLLSSGGLGGYPGAAHVEQDRAVELGRYGEQLPRSDFDGFDSRAAVGPRSGIELPPLPSDQPDPRYRTEPLDRAALRRPSGTPGSPPPPAPQASPSPPAAGPAQSLGGPPSAMTPPGPPGYVGPPAPSAMAGGPTGVLPSTVPVPPPGEGPGGAIYRTRRASLAALLWVIAVVAEVLLLRVLLTGFFASTVRADAVLAGLLSMAGVPLTAMGMYGLMTGAAAAAGPNPARAWLRTPLAYLPIGLTLLLAVAIAAR